MSEVTDQQMQEFADRAVRVMQQFIEASARFEGEDPGPQLYAQVTALEADIVAVGGAGAWQEVNQTTGIAAFVKDNAF